MQESLERARFEDHPAFALVRNSMSTAVEDKRKRIAGEPFALFSEVDEQ